METEDDASLVFLMTDYFSVSVDGAAAIADGLISCFRIAF